MSHHDIVESILWFLSSKITYVESLPLQSIWFNTGSDVIIIGDFGGTTHIHQFPNRLIWYLGCEKICMIRASGEWRRIHTIDRNPHITEGFCKRLCVLITKRLHLTLRWFYHRVSNTISLRMTIENFSHILLPICFFMPTNNIVTTFFEFSLEREEIGTDHIIIAILFCSKTVTVHCANFFIKIIRSKSSRTIHHYCRLLTFAH
mmetsp:Transcript_11510/g.13181  ORF Transcript_11510/g.13181 Transcript_11510/m.13181 type:complete len:204 (-) Transcript_11510:405-1016(-)